MNYANRNRRRLLSNGLLRPAAVEPLEVRRLLAVITVTTSADDLTPGDGTVSLREAITALNAGSDLGDPDITAQAPGTFSVNDTINFNISASDRFRRSTSAPQALVVCRR